MVSGRAAQQPRARVVSRDRPGVLDRVIQDRRLQPRRRHRLADRGAGDRAGACGGPGPGQDRAVHAVPVRHRLLGRPAVLPFPEGRRLACAGFHPRALCRGARHRVRDGAAARPGSRHVRRAALGRPDPIRRHRHRHRGDHGAAGVHDGGRTADARQPYCRGRRADLRVRRGCPNLVPDCPGAAHAAHRPEEGGRRPRSQPRHQARRRRTSHLPTSSSRPARIA